MTEFPVSQAVYTDPGGAAAGGYVLAATSHGIRLEEADFLSHSPGISEYLHSHESPGPFLSFFELPTGRWALVRRFVAGERKVRGYHRVVVHMLVLPEVLVEAVEGDGWLMASSKTRYRDAQGAVHTLAKLGRQAAKPGIKALDDLGCAVPENPRRHSLELLEDCRGFLEETLGGETLGENLAWIFDALSRRRRVLLPQGLEPEQLLSLATASLPRRDRLRASWTTHFAAGVRVRFRIANAPDPEAAVMLHRQVDEWRVLPQKLHGGARQHSAGTDLARVVAGGGEPLRKVVEGFHQHGLSLLEDGDQVRRWISYRLADLDLLSRGCESLDQLRQLLRRNLPGWRRQPPDPWLDDATLLHGVCVTARRALASGKSAEDLTSHFFQAVAAEDWAADLFTPATLSRMTKLQTPWREPLMVLLAVGLVRRQLPAPPAAPEAREELLTYFSESPLKGLIDERPDSADWLLADLAIELGRCGSPRFSDALKLAAGMRFALERIHQSLRPEPEDVPAALELLGVALDHEQPDTADAVTSQLLIPTLAATPHAAPKDPRLLDRGLDHLRHRPQLLAAALGTWRDELLTRAVVTLRQWLEECSAAALAAAAELAQETLNDFLFEIPAIHGLAAELRSAGAPSRVWLRFAVAEAKRLDHHPDPTAAEAFAQFADGATLTPDDATQAARQVLETLGAAIASGTAGAGQQALLALAAPGMPALAEETVVALSALCHAENPHLLNWEPQIRHAIEALGAGAQRTPAAQLGHNWWQALAEFDWDTFPVATLTTLQSLRGFDLSEVAATWTERAPSLGDLPGEDDLLRTLDREFAAQPELHLSFRNRLTAARVRRGETRLEDALHQLDAWAAEIGQASESADVQGLFAKEARVLLPDDHLERAKCLVRILLSDQVLQTVKSSLEKGVLKATFSQVGDGPWDWLPAPQHLAARGTLLLTAVAQIGRCWDHHSKLTEGVLVSALISHRFNAAGALLATARMRKLRDRSLLQHLVEGRDSSLPDRLQEALADPSGGWWLENSTEEIQRL